MNYGNRKLLLPNWANCQVLSRKEANFVKIADLKAHNASQREAL